MGHLQTVLTVLTFEGEAESKMEKSISVVVCQMRNAKRDFFPVPILSLTKLGTAISTLPSFQYLLFWENNWIVQCHFLVATVYSTLDSFILSWHLHQSILHLLSRRHNPFCTRYTAVFFFFFAFSLIHIKYCFPFNCWWKLPAVVWLSSQSIIDRYLRRGYLNSLRLAWFTFLRHG